MSHGGITHGRGWGSSRTCSRDHYCDCGSGPSRSRARQCASSAQRVDHHLDEAPIPLSETIPKAQTDFITGIDNNPKIQPYPSEAYVADPAIPTTSSIIDKIRIHLLASSTKDRFTLFHGGTDPWEAQT